MKGTKRKIRILALLCAAALCFALCACNNDEGMETDLSVDTNSDIGLYFFANDGTHVRYSDGISSAYFDSEKPTVAFFHGWMTEVFEEGEICDNASSFVPRAIEAGYNVCSLDYSHHARNLPSLFDYIWTGFEGSHSVACRFAREYAACFKNYDKEVTFISHSFGAHSATATAYLLSKMSEQGIVGKNVLPKRITFADPYMGDVLLDFAGGIQGSAIENLKEPIGGRSCTEVIADVMQYLVNKEDIVMDVYCGMPLAYDQFLEKTPERREACKKKLYDVGAWTILKGVQDRYGLGGDTHMYALEWVFDSFFASVKKDGDKYFPTASLDNATMRTLKGKLFESTYEGVDVENDTLVEVER